MPPDAVLFALQENRISVEYTKGFSHMKKKIWIYVLLIAIVALSAVVCCYAPAREATVQGWKRHAVPVWESARQAILNLIPAEKAAPLVVETPGVEPAAQVVEENTPAVEPASAAKTAPAPEPVAPAESAPAEPAPQPAPLPALNAEAEALLPRAEAGDAVAQFNLARLYALGEGMAINRQEFVRWCTTAADQGLPEAQFTLGCCYLRGLGVEKNEAEGRRLLEAAAAAGFAPAADELKRGM